MAASKGREGGRGEMRDGSWSEVGEMDGLFPVGSSSMSSLLSHLKGGFEDCWYGPDAIRS